MLTTDNSNILYNSQEENFGTSIQTSMNLYSLAQGHSGVQNPAALRASQGCRQSDKLRHSLEAFSLIFPETSESRASPPTPHRVLVLDLASSQSPDVNKASAVKSNIEQDTVSASLTPERRALPYFHL